MLCMQEFRLIPPLEKVCCSCCVFTDKQLFYDRFSSSYIHGSLIVMYADFYMGNVFVSESHISFLTLFASPCVRQASTLAAC